MARSPPRRLRPRLRMPCELASMVAALVLGRWSRVCRPALLRVRLRHGPGISQLVVAACTTSSQSEFIQIRSFDVDLSGNSNLIHTIFALIVNLFSEDNFGIFWLVQITRRRRHFGQFVGVPLPGFL